MKRIPIACLFLGILTAEVATQVAEPIADLSPGRNYVSSDIKGFDPSLAVPESGFVRMGNALYGRTLHATGVTLWRIDTATGVATEVTTQIGLGTPVVADAGAGQRLYFLVGSKLFESDGSPAGTRSRALPPSQPFFLAGSVGRRLLLRSHGQPFGIWRFEVATGFKLLTGHPSVNGRGPERFVTNAANTQCYFVSAEGRELWRTDGTPSGTTRLLVRTIPWISGPLVEHNGGILFAGNGANGVELWRADGTLNGAVEVRDIEPGSGSSEPKLVAGAVGSGFLYFTASTSATGREIWRTDGTRAGTTLVHETGNGTASSEPGRLVVDSGRLYYVGQRIPQQAYAFDGNTTQPLGPAKIRVGLFLARVGRVAIVASDLQFSELHVSDGTTAGTRRVSIDHNHHPDPKYMTAVPGRGLYFAATGIRGRELWRTDGTVSGTALFADVAPGSEPAHTRFFFSGAFHAVLGARAYLECFAFSQPSGLFATDGERLRRLHPTGAQSGFFPLVRNGRVQVVFSATGRTGLEPWVMDGAGGGKQQLADIMPGLSSSRPTRFASLGDVVTFVAWDPQHGAETWITDGTPQGTRLLLDAVPGPTGSDPTRAVRFQDKLWFLTGNSAGPGLWSSDGTSGGTRRVAGMRPIDGAAPVVFAGRLWAIATDGLWASDGTAAGTVKVGATARGVLTPAWDRLFFIGEDAATGREPWVTDGTVAGTRRLADVAPGSASSRVESFAIADGRVFFAAQDPARGRELWVTDGTPAGTRLVVDLEPGSGSSEPLHLAPAAGGVYFSAKRPGSGRELHFSDGTASGTQLVVDLMPGTESGFEGPLAFVGDRLVFVGQTPAFGRELYRLRLPARAHSLSMASHCAGDLRLEAGAPVLGRSLTLRGTATRATSTTATVLGLPTLSPVALPGSTACHAFFDLSQSALVLAARRGTPWQTTLSIPNAFGLDGHSAMVQAFELLRTGELTASNALRLVVGR